MDYTTRHPMRLIKLWNFVLLVLYAGVFAVCVYLMYSSYPRMDGMFIGAAAIGSFFLLIPYVHYTRKRKAALFLFVLAFVIYPLLGLVYIFNGYWSFREDFKLIVPFSLMIVYALSILSWWYIFERKKRLSYDVPGTAVITAIDVRASLRRHSSYRYYYSYQDETHKTHSGEFERSFFFANPGFRVGDRFAVLYDRTHPDMHVIDGDCIAPPEIKA